jgi:ABC-2 type transport system permease protein
VASTSRSQADAGLGTALALARRAFRDARVRTIAFVYLFALYAYIQPAGYRHSYPTITERLSFARSFGPNKALRLFYGEPHDLLTVSGYTAWRVGGTLAIFAAVFGLLAAVRALRTEEDTGRMELVLAGAVGRDDGSGFDPDAQSDGFGLLGMRERTALLDGELQVNSTPGKGTTLSVRLPVRRRAEDSTGTRTKAGQFSAAADA